MTVRHCSLCRICARALIRGYNHSRTLSPLWSQALEKGTGMREYWSLQEGCAQILHHAFQFRVHFKKSGLNSRTSNLRTCHSCKPNVYKMSTVNFVGRYEVQNYFHYTYLNSMYLPLMFINNNKQSLPS